MTARAYTAVAALLLLVTGLTLGLVPHTAAGGSCGSAFQPSGSAAISDLIGNTAGAAVACDDVLDGARQIAVILLGLGAAALLVAIIAGRRPTGT